MSDQKLKLAVFIDFDNVEIGVKTTLGLHFDVGAVLEALKERGEIITKVAYGDWKRAGEYGRTMAQHAVRLVQRVMTPGGDKNGADINLALDALEMAFTHDHINAFVIVGGDSDFITLVEKLKQYDRKVFVVGGRAFTSQVMQKNCTEFIAYENVAKGARRAEGGRAATVGKAAPIDEAVALVKRALKVLADREVSPQLGLLKSTLLQLDSSFSERDYGTSTFRDFADKLEEKGIVTLKHSGRSTLVELADGNGARTVAPSAGADEEAPREREPREARGDARGGARDSGEGREGGAREAAADPEALASGVEMVRRVLTTAKTPPRWPMYLRQMKQVIRNGEPDFDERKYGSIVELMRAAQKEGLVRLERDRQGGLRVFAGSAMTGTSSFRHGWAAAVGAEDVDRQAPADAVSASDPSEIVEPAVEEAGQAEGSEPAAEEKPKRTRRTRKTAAKADGDEAPAKPARTRKTAAKRTRKAAAAQS